MQPRATYTGPQNLANSYDCADDQRYNLRGTPKPDRSPGSWRVDLCASYQWNLSVQTYVGINNAFNDRQEKKDRVLWLGGDGALDVTHIRGRSIGRTVVAGLRLSLPDAPASQARVQGQGRAGPLR